MKSMSEATWKKSFVDLRYTTKYIEDLLYLPPKMTSIGMNYDIIIISFCVQYDNKTQGRNRIDLLAIYANNQN